MTEAKTRNQYVAALIAASASLAAGMAFAWTSPIQSQVVVNDDGECDGKVCLTKTEFAWVATSMSIGSLSFGFFAGPLMSKIGRKASMFVYFAPLLCGWLLLTFVQAKWQYYAGRFLLGVGMGGCGIIVPIYICEISQPSIRGRLTTYFQVTVSAGNLVTYILGYLFHMFTQNIISTAIVVVYGICLLIIPESPRYFIYKDNATKAEKSLKWLRGEQYHSQEEIEEMIELQRTQEPKQFSKLFTNKTNRKALMIVVGLIIAFQFSGLNAVLFYTSDVFDQANIKISPDLAAMMVGVFILLGTITSSFTVDRYGRKILLLISNMLMFATFMLMGVFFQLQSKNPDNVAGLETLPVVLICIYVYSNSIGVASVTWVIMGEIFAPNVKDSAAAISMTFNYAGSIVVTLLFPFIEQNFGIGVAFFTFGACIAVAYVFVIFMVPETKQKTLSEIQALLNKKLNLTSENK